ncbi:MAG TPA: histidine--tRNA ligase [Flexilinea sp.]|nr:histidine--tRNA ligase [Flexilinea sp.]
MMKEIVQKVKGTRDFYPEDMAFRTWLYHQIRIVSERFGYQEYEGPMLEKLELYAAKSGEELVKEQAYVFNDRGGGEIALRPELTPTLARMVAQKQKELVYPLRWWSFGPFWRYEQPQKGRTREFFQWNIDLIGAAGYEADAELLAICAAFFEQLGLTSEQVQINVNNRRLMDAQLEKIGIDQDLKPAVYKLIDRCDKLRPDAWREYASECGVSPVQLNALTVLLENRDLWKESEELSTIFKLIQAMGYEDYINYDPHVIRGLLYYTGTVFEARDKAPEGRALSGGGRYENLVADVGGDPLSGVGFAMGDVMISVVLEKYGKYPELSTQPARIVVTCFNSETLPETYGLAEEIRRSGINVITYPEAAKLDKQLKFANRIGARFALIAGPDEISAGKVTVKDLTNRTQETIEKQDLIEFLKQSGF